MNQRLLLLRNCAFVIVLSQWILPSSNGFVVRCTSLSPAQLPMTGQQRWRDYAVSRTPPLVQPAFSSSKPSLINSRTRLYNSQDDVNEDSPSTPSLRVGIIGAGSIAFGTASLLSSLGHDPMIWSPSGAGTRELIHGVRTEASESAIEAEAFQIQSTGALGHKFHTRVACCPRALVRSNDNVLVMALPANGHRSVMETMAPEIIEWMMEQQQLGEEGEVPMMHIIISSHASLGAVYFMQLLREERRRYLTKNQDSQMESSTNLSGMGGTQEDVDCDIGIRITAWGTTAITARKTSGSSVNVLTIRQSVDFCIVPSSPEDDDIILQPTDNFMTGLPGLLADGYNLCTTLFGKRFQYRKGGLLAISLSNLNPQNHLGIVLGNMSRMDPPPPPPSLSSTENVPKSETSIEPWYQGKNITPNIGRLMESLDRERIDIAKALDIDVRTIYQHFSWSFHVPLETPVVEAEFDTSDSSSALEQSSPRKMRPSTISEMNQQMHYYLKNDVLGPAFPDSRYVLEDVPYGLVLTVILGQLVNRPAVLHESGIRIVSAMYGRDFMSENELLQGLGLIRDRLDDGNGIDVLPSLAKWKEMAYLGYFRDN